MNAKLAAAGVAVIGLAWTLLLISTGERIPRPPEIGDRAPDFHAVQLRTGAEAQRDDYEGDVVLLNFWATWCAPCRYEIPSMQRLHEQLAAEGLRIVAVTLDDAPLEVVERFANEYGVTFDVLHDSSRRVEVDYHVTSLPQSYVLDRRGRIVSRHIGPENWDEVFFIDRFTQLLQQ